MFFDVLFVFLNCALKFVNFLKFHDFLMFMNYAECVVFESLYFLPFVFLKFLDLGEFWKYVQNLQGSHHNIYIYMHTPEHK